MWLLQVLKVEEEKKKMGEEFKEWREEVRERKKRLIPSYETKETYLPVQSPGGGKVRELSWVIPLNKQGRRTSEWKVLRGTKPAQLPVSSVVVRRAR